MTETQERERPWSVRTPRGFRATLRSEAESYGLSLNAYVLWLIAIGRKYLKTGKYSGPADETKDAAQAMATFASTHVPNNVNQIAKAMNSGSFPATPETEAFMRDVLQAIIDIRDLLARKLGRKRGGA